MGWRRGWCCYERVLVIGLLAIYIATRKAFAVDKFEGKYTGFKSVLANKWYVDELYDAVIVRPLQGISRFSDKVIERLGIDGLVNGVGKSVRYGSDRIRLLQSGQVGSYLFVMVLGIIALFAITFFWIH